MTERKEMLPSQITIIGFGLIGSSIAHVMRTQSPETRIICADINPAVCEKVMELGLADHVTTDLAEGVKDSDLVVLSIPVGACGVVAEQIGPHLKEGCVVTDTGSVKRAVIDFVAPHLPSHAALVPSHPVAGTEHSGPEAGFATLFEGRWCILTPLPDVPLKAVEMVTKLWEAGGAMIEIMDAEHHDLVLGITSHLPHLIAYTIVGTAADLETHTKEEVIKFSASGFRDFTRIAASDPIMWRDVFLYNKDAVLDIVQRFTEDFERLQKAVREGDGAMLESFFTHTRHIRREVIEAGQADYRTAEGSREWEE